MTKIEIRTADAPAPGGAYSQGVAANGFLYTAGMGPHDPVSGRIAGDTIEEQTAQTLRNLRAVLATHELDLDDAVKVTAHLADLDRDFGGFNRVYESWFTPPYPVRTTVGSTLAGIRVEIDLVAALPGGSPA